MSVHIAGMPCGLPSLRSLPASRQPSNAQSACSYLKTRGASSVIFFNLVSIATPGEAWHQYMPDLPTAMDIKHEYELCC